MMRRSPLKPSTKPMRARSLLKPSLREKIGGTGLKTKQRAVTAEERELWNRIAGLGCIACRMDGIDNPLVSIHHVAGRTAPGCHMKVLPLCAGHHQDGAGNDKTMIAVHPWKSRFEDRYGRQVDLLDEVMGMLAETNNKLGVA